MLAVAMIAATLSAVSGSAWPRPRPAAWRVRPCSTRRTPVMAGRIVGAGVDVAGADRGADGAHGGRGGALVDPLGKVGGDGERIGWQRLVAGECGPFGPPAPRRPILRPRVAGAAIAECLIDARPVGCAQFDRQGGGERSGGVDAGSCPAPYHQL